MKRLRATVRQAHGTESNRSAGCRLQQNDAGTRRRGDAGNDVTPSPRHPIAPSHNGAALLEVLMAVIVMGIGVLTVATLFPISVLRAVQATKLTNATIMRYNAEALMNMFPRMIADPDNNNNPATLNAVGEHTGTNYLLDPLGFELHQSLGTGYENEFGGPTMGGTLPRFEFTATDEASAIALVGDPDSWNSIVDGIVINATGTSVQVDGDRVALANIDVSAPAVARAILVDESGRFSVVRPIDSITDTAPVGPLDTINWVTPLPAGFTPVSVRVEMLEPTNFSWMLTVRNSGTSDIQVDVVVFYKRNTDAADEQPFPMARGGTLSEYVVSYAPTSRKKWKRGSYLLDPDGARWYRVQRIVEGNGQDTLILDRAPAAAITRAMFPRGIVDVYPLGNKAPL